VQFEWDPKKARANLLKHGVSFDEGATVFRDPLARIHDDPDHSIGEHREILIGYSAAGQLLPVSFTERRESLRIIHVRRVDAAEHHEHEENIQ